MLAAEQIGRALVAAAEQVIQAVDDAVAASAAEAAGTGLSGLVVSEVRIPALTAAVDPLSGAGGPRGAGVDTDGVAGEQIDGYRAEAEIARIVEAGGSVAVQPFDIQIGRCAVVEDPWGNPLVLLDMSKGRLVTDCDP